MPLKQKLAYIASGVLLVVGLQLGTQLISSRATADQHERQATVKYVFTADYPLGKKGEYLEWIKSVAPALEAPDDVKRIASYDNYYGSNPHRLVEFEFANMEDATKYFGREELRQIIGDLTNHTSRLSFNAFVLRGDYTKN